MLRLFTDSDTDMTLEDCEKYGYSLISMPYTINMETTYPYVDFKEFDDKTFYDILRGGVLPTTSALNVEEYKAYFEPVFEKGDDILYVHFSKAMSGTFNALNLACEELKEKYPERTLYTVDTKAITIGSNNIVKEIGDLYKNGATIDEILKWAETEVDKFTCYFYADDLKFFKRSGRVSGIAATMGQLIMLKPIIHMNSEGKMVSIDKAIGRTKSLQKIMTYVEKLQENLKEHRVIIGHTDLEVVAKQLGEMLKEKYGDDLNIEYVKVNPTAGSHCGPNCIGVSFHGIHR